MLKLSDNLLKLNSIVKGIPKFEGLQQHNFVIKIPTQQNSMPILYEMFFITFEIANLQHVSVCQTYILQKNNCLTLTMFDMEYLRRNTIGSIIMIIVFAVYGFYASKDTHSFLYSMGLLAITFIVGYFAVSIQIRDKEKLFLHKPEEKISYHMFFKKAVYPVLVTEIFIISIVVSGIFDFSEIIRGILQAVVFGLLYIFLNGIASLIEEYSPSNYNFIMYRASIRAAAKSQNDAQNGYFLLGIKYYDKHLRRKFGLTINTIDNIFSRYVLLEREERNKLLTSLLNIEKDSLAGFKVLNESVEFNGNILTTVSNIQKIKDFGTIIFPIVTIVLSFIQMVLSFK